MFMFAMPFLALGLGMGVREAAHTDDTLKSGEDAPRRILRHQLTGTAMAAAGAGLAVRHGLRGGLSPIKIAINAALGAATGSILGDSISTKLTPGPVLATGAITGVAIGAMALLAPRAHSLSKIGISKLATVVKKTSVGTSVLEHMSQLTTKADSAWTRKFFDNTLVTGVAASLATTFIHPKAQQDVAVQAMHIDARKSAQEFKAQQDHQEAMKLHFSSSTIYTTNASGHNSFVNALR